VTWEMRAMAGNPKFDASQDIPYVPYHAYADLIGLHGIKLDRADQIDGAWEEAFAATRPVIVDARTDPEEPPIPPHITFDEVRAMTSSFLGDPRAGLPGAVEAVREVARSMIPGR
ncbi:MAG: thiamine pyrophosphate-requiring protein, partial [Candidatus Dormibacteria bacterium]